jgi:hypothetical protein
MSDVIENRRDKHYDGNKTRWVQMNERIKQMKIAVFFMFFRIRNEIARMIITSAII